MSDPGDDGLYYDHDSGPGFEWTRPAMAAAALVAVIAVLAVWVLWPGDNSNSGDTATPPSTPAAAGGNGPVATTAPGSLTPATEVEQPPGPPGDCPADRQSSDEIPPPIAGTVTWDLYNGGAMPRSSTAGPLRVEGSGLARCYERSPSGAVLMAINFNGRVLLTPDPTPMVAAQMVENEEKASTIKELGELPAPLVESGSFCQFVAYKVKSFNQDSAAIELVTQCGANDLRTAAVEVRWIGDDWQIVLETQDDPDAPPERVPSLDGYTPFRGVGG